MVALASQITSVTIGYSTVYSGENQRKHRRFASLAFVRGIHRSPVNSLHKWSVTRKMFPFDDVIMPRIAVSIVPGVISIIISIPLLNSRNVMYMLSSPAKCMACAHLAAVIRGSFCPLIFRPAYIVKSPETFYIKFSQTAECWAQNALRTHRQWIHCW